MESPNRHVLSGYLFRSTSLSVIKAGIRNRIKRELTICIKIVVYMLSLYIRNLIYVDNVVNIYI